MTDRADEAGGRLIGPPRAALDYFPLLRFMLLAAVVVLGFGVLVRLGLVALLFETDRTHLSSIILAIFVATSVHCLWQTTIVSRELAAARLIRDAIEATPGGFGTMLTSPFFAPGGGLEASVLTDHIRNLVAKARAQGGRRLDQTLLLRSLAARLRGREKLGWFVSEALLRLALLGTAVGFILMLVPIAGLTSFDVETLRLALAGMSGGMAIALNVTVAGIACALILKLEYYFLDDSISELFRIITEVTEVHVVSSLEGEVDGRA